jgi:spore coat polysaccharide biosynthesis protein SpsF
VFIIIQARMTSTRLPGKIMLPLCGKPVMQIMLERLDSLKTHLIIATTDDGSEQPIVDLCNKLAIRYYRGDTDNVLSRYYLAASKFGAKEKDVIVRLTSDCPLIDPDITRQTVNYFMDNHFDYVSAGTGTGFPRGMDTEVFTFDLLQQAYENATLDYEKEHVTPYIYMTCGKQLKLGQYQNSQNHSHYRLTLDEPLDFDVISEVYRLFDCQTDFSYEELINKLKQNPQVARINQQVEQKKVKQKNA